MKNLKRVVVTGMGVISPIGNSIEEFWNSIKLGKCGIDEITRFDTTNFKVKLASEVKNFNINDYIEDKKVARRLDLFCQYGIASTKQAIENSRLNLENEDLDRIGVSFGSGTGGLPVLEKEMKKLIDKGPNRVAPLFVPMMITNMAAGNISILFGLRGKCINVVTACATGTHSIGEAFRSIQCGEADVMVAGGCEGSITELGIAGFSALTALTTQTDKLKASIPFDKDRSGFVMGEGAGAVILESLEHALKRGANILAEVVGYGATSDAYHITSPMEDGSGAGKAMKLAMKEAEIESKDIDYINAHGTSTKLNDLFETRAIKYAFGKEAYNVNINSTKSMMGHLLGAAGAVEFITCVKSILDGFIHKTLGLNESEEELDLNYTKEAINKDINYAMTNSMGFGGHNATIVIKKYNY